MPTISPTYMLKGVPNPYYTVDPNTERLVKASLKKFKRTPKQLIFECVDKPSGTNIYETPKAKYIFQLTDVKKRMPFYVVLGKKQIKGHYGSANRKDSTASSNVNEYCTVHFLVNKFEGVKELENKSCKLKKNKTGILYGDDSPITYEDLCQLLDKDETAERDVLIGYENSVAVKKDIKGQKIKNLYWVPRGKPEGINPKNPSDVIIQFKNNSFQGYSNKIAAGKDETPKFNTNIIAFYEKFDDKKQVNDIKKLVNKSWNNASEQVPKNKKIAKAAIEDFSIEDQPFTEKARETELAFASLSKQFKKDGLDFYADGFYYLFRNEFIRQLGKYISKPDNLIYFLNTIYYYTYGDPKMKYVECPYKLLIGRENQKSEIKDVSEDSRLKSVLEVKDSKKISDIKFVYDNKSQSFKMNFTFRKTKVVMPVTARTRATGGWAGKSLFINTPGLKIEQ